MGDMDGYERLASAYRAWVIDENGWSQPEVLAMGGPSTSTQTKVAKGNVRLSPRTLRQVDTVMGWPAGTAYRVTQGAPAPTPSLEKTDDAGRDPLRPRPVKPAARPDDLGAVLRDLREINTRLMLLGVDPVALAAEAVEGDRDEDRDQIGDDPS